MMDVYKCSVTISFRLLLLFFNTFYVVLRRLIKQNVFDVTLIYLENTYLYSCKIKKGMTKS